MTKKLVKKFYEFQTWKVIDGTLGTLQKQVNSWVDEYGQDAELDCCDSEITITTFREETETEYLERLRTEAARANREDFHDRREWERLKKKYGV